jgi:tyrocidine synthetase-3
VNSLNINEKCNYLRLVVLGGEAVSISDVKNYKNHFCDDCLLINGLGPTESTITIQNFINKSFELNSAYVPIGYPVDKTKVYITRNDGELADVFEYGEILYQSDYLALGYLNDMNKSEKVFPRDIFNTGERYYKSGDIGRILTNGIIEFKGRQDNLIKIRGFRVELGEIENQLVAHDKIKEAVVIAKENKNDIFIVAYYVSESKIETVELNSFLSQNLPAYMIPSHYEYLKTIPLNSNGKIDKNALPDPMVKIVDDYIPSSNQIEVKLVEIWSEVLEISKKQISTNSSFFELGGHSLKATVLVSKIHKILNVVIPLVEIFKDPTIKGIASFINTMEFDIKQSIYEKSERKEIEL